MSALQCKRGEAQRRACGHEEAISSASTAIRMTSTGAGIPVHNSNWRAP